jgi:hypothetical protein
MLPALKEFTSNPLVISIISLVSGYFLKVLEAAYKNNKRDFFSLPFSEQTKAVQWLKETPAATDPLDKAEQQLRLQSWGLHDDRDLSCKLITFYSTQPQTCKRALKTMIRLSECYTVSGGHVFLLRKYRWYMPLLVSVFPVIVLANAITGSLYFHNNPLVHITASIAFVCTVIMFCTMSGYFMDLARIIKKINAHAPEQQAH